MLEDYWYIALSSSQLKHKPISVTMFDEPIVLFRSQNKVTALEDRCAHRHAPLSKGKICQGKISCPYHGWQYDESGKLAYIPSLGVPKGRLQIKSYPTKEYGGYIWICPSGKPSQEAPKPFIHLNDKGYATFRMQNTFDASVEQCLENFLDCPHAMHVHDFWFRTRSNEKTTVRVSSLVDGAKVEYFKEPRKKSLVWWLLSNSKATMKHTDRFIAPATSRVEYIFSDNRHYIITSHCTPINNIKTEVYTTISFRFGHIACLIKPFFHMLSKIIIKQDVEILNHQANTIKMFPESNFKSTESDLLYPYILSFRDAIAFNKPHPQPDNTKELSIIL